MAATVEALAQGCAQVQPLWAALRVPDRARYLRRAAQAVVDELDELVPLFAQAHDRTRGELGAERIARLFARASLPEGLLAIAPPGAPLEPEGLAKAFVPGSEEGRLAAAACSVAGVPVVVDEGGWAAALVLSDAAVRRAARGV